MKTEFEALISKGTFSNRVMKIVYMVVGSLVLFGNLATINGENYQQNLTFLVVISVVFGLFYWFNRSKFKPLQFWLDLFYKNSEELIWVKPITTKHTAYLVVTYAKSYQFELYLKDGTHLKIDCPEHRRKVFYNGIKKYAPHAHLGYSREVNKVYRRNRATFLETLKQKGLYRSVNDYNL